MGACRTRGALCCGARAGPPLCPRWCCWVEGRAIVMPGAALPERRRSFRPGSRPVRRTTPMNSPSSTAREACIRSPGRWRSGTVRPADSPRAGRGTRCGVRDDALARRARPCVLVPARRALATAPFDAGRTLLALMRHTVAARENPEHSMPILKQAVSGGARLSGPRGSWPAGFRSSQAPPYANADMRRHNAESIGYARHDRWRRFLIARSSSCRCVRNCRGLRRLENASVGAVGCSVI